METLSKESSHGISRFSLSKDSLEKLRMFMVPSAQTTVCICLPGTEDTVLFLHLSISTDLVLNRCPVFSCYSCHSSETVLVYSLDRSFSLGEMLETSQGHEFMLHSDIMLTVI